MAGGRGTHFFGTALATVVFTAVTVLAIGFAIAFTGAATLATGFATGLATGGGAFFATTFLVLLALETGACSIPTAVPAKATSAPRTIKIWQNVGRAVLPASRSTDRLIFGEQNEPSSHNRPPLIPGPSSCFFSKPVSRLGNSFTSDRRPPRLSSLRLCPPSCGRSGRPF